MNAQLRQKLLQTLQDRFARHMHRHPGLAWEGVLSRLQSRPAVLEAIHAMESSGGEPDVVGFEPEPEQLFFCDCSAESPAGRRSLCYDREAWDARKENKPAGCATDAAAAMGIELLTEAQYRELQRFGPFDAKTSSWVATPAEVRALGGALFCDHRYGRVFTYHNGAQSYYAARGFRGRVRV